MKSQAALDEIVRHCDALLKTAEVGDYDGAMNGLQVQNAGRVTRIAAAVDASFTTIAKAIEQKSDLLVVHHGLFWSKRQPWTGKSYDLIRMLVENDLAIYSSHLPLDLHPRLGNNAQLCAALGLCKTTPFFVSKGQPIGLRAAAALGRAALADRLGKATGGRVTVVPGGPNICRHIGVVTGGAGAEVKQAAAEGIDTFITGEGPHWTFALAEELGVNVLYAGHYATETFGVRALANHLSRKFQVPWSFIDHPTGL